MRVYLISKTFKVYSQHNCRCKRKGEAKVSLCCEEEVSRSKGSGYVATTRPKYQMLGGAAGRPCNVRAEQGEAEALNFRADPPGGTQVASSSSNNSNRSTGLHSPECSAHPGGHNPSPGAR